MTDSRRLDELDLAGIPPAFAHAVRAYCDRRESELIERIVGRITRGHLHIHIPTGYVLSSVGDRTVIRPMSSEVRASEQQPHA